MKPPTKFEREVLDIVLVELRRAMRTREQLDIHIDPWFRNHGEGAYILAAPNAAGRTYEISGEPPRRQRRRK